MEQQYRLNGFRFDDPVQFLKGSVELVFSTICSQFLQNHGSQDFALLDRDDYLDKVSLMGFDEFPINDIGKELIDVLVVVIFVSFIKFNIIPITHSRHQFDIP